MDANQGPPVDTLAPLEFAASAEAESMSQEDVETFLQTLQKSKMELEIARQQFETVVDPLLIDHIVFRLGAAERHFNYLFQLARKWNICVDGMQWYWVENG
jgi:Protein of unknown function (DUF2508)